MGLFLFGELTEIADTAISVGLASQRETLLFAFSPALIANLSGSDAPTQAGAIKLDLNDLNDMVEPLGGEIPMAMWLQNAASLALAHPTKAKFFNKMALLAVQRAAALVQPPAAAASDAGAIPEKILFRSALLPARFISLASRRAASVARLSVFSFECGAQRLLPSGNPDGTYGTGWLIGPRHLITNRHVIIARGKDEKDPSDADLEQQVAQMKIEFDYDEHGAHTSTIAAAALSHVNEAMDYAIIELAVSPGREPLPLLRTLPSFSTDNPLAANIIQHPAGEPRQFAIRNNLVAAITAENLQYFTDTAGGSSGSPVFDDGWRVMALHKASTAKFGNFSYQGKDTAWINIGTLMSAICADLERDAPACWAAIGIASG